jgi:hypothetical protein
MSPESARSKTVTTENISFAHAVAIRYRSLHPQLPQDDCVSIANLALIELFDGSVAIPTNNAIAGSVECALRAELLRLSKRRKREETLHVNDFGVTIRTALASTQNFGESGISKNSGSLRDLRSAQSLNPRAHKQDTHEPLTKGFVAALGEVCESAVRQTQETHPLHAEYVGAVGVSRDLVSQSLADRKLKAELFQRNEERMARRRAA